MLFVTLLESVSLVVAIPSIPPPVGANATAVQQHISAAVIAQRQLVTVPPGTYVFSDAALTIAGATNLVIDATGVTFVFYLGHGVSISNCHNLTVKGLTLDSDPPNYAQGVVTSLPGNVCLLI